MLAPRAMVIRRNANGLPTKEHKMLLILFRDPEAGDSSTFELFVTRAEVSGQDIDGIFDLLKNRGEVPNAWQDRNSIQSIILVGFTNPNASTDIGILTKWERIDINPPQRKRAPTWHTDAKEEAKGCGFGCCSY